MEFLAKNWKKLIFLLGGALSLAGGGAYMADCNGAGDILSQGGAALQQAGEKPVKQPAATE